MLGNWCPRVLHKLRPVDDWNLGREKCLDGERHNSRRIGHAEISIYIYEGISIRPLRSYHTSPRVQGSLPHGFYSPRCCQPVSNDKISAGPLVAGQPVSTGCCTSLRLVGNWDGDRGAAKVTGMACGMAAFVQMRP
jgi:hypothetical protein